MRKPPLVPGEKFNRLTVIAFSHPSPSGHRITRFRCDCGTEKAILEKHVRSGAVKSCGCLRADANVKRNLERRTHGMSRTPEYQAFWAAKLRCTDPNNQAWKDYGGRGITFEFESFEQFLAVMGKRPSPDHSLERINNEAGYSPANCKWATWEEQANNRRRSTKRPPP